MCVFALIGDNLSGLSVFYVKWVDRIFLCCNLSACMGGEQPQRQRVVVLLIHLLKEAQKRRATGILTCRGPLDAAKDSLPHSEAALSKLDK